MSRYCLDTSAYSRFRAGDARVVGLIDEADAIGLPAIVIGELRFGFKLGRRREENESALRTFIADPSVDVLHVDSEVADHYSDIHIDLRRQGTPIPTNDIWIAATAARAGMTVLAYDDHYDSISRVGSIVLGSD